MFGRRCGQGRVFELDFYEVEPAWRMPGRGAVGFPFTEFGGRGESVLPYILPGKYSETRSSLTRTPQIALSTEPFSRRSILQ